MKERAGMHLTTTNSCSTSSSPATQTVPVAASTVTTTERSFLHRARSKVILWLQKSLGRRPPQPQQQVDGHGTERGPDLDEEMEKVFAMADEERFDLARISTASPDSTASKKSFNEKDYSMHRKKSYPHMHMPLKSIHSRSMRKRGITSPRESESESAEGYGSPEAPDSRKVSLTGTDSDVALSPSSQQKPNDYAQRFAFPEEEEAQTQEHLLRTDSEPQISERAADYDSPTDSSRRVQFQIGETSKTAEGEDNDKADANPEEEEERRDSIKDEESIDKRPKRKHSRHHHHHHRRKYSLQEGMLNYSSRLRTGSDFAGADGRRISIQPEEASTLQEQDIDDLTSHRFDDTKGLRRYKISSKSSTSSMIHVGRKDGVDPLQTMLPLQSLKKIIDRSPHEVFVQLDELHGEGEEREWKETARWIKYEEDVEEGADRWGQPHVASLSFHSLLNLRRCLETGVVLLDLEEKDLPGVAYRVVEQMVVDEMIEPEDKPTVMRALLLRHRHVNEHDRFRFGIRRTFSSYTSLQSLMDEDGESSGDVEFSEDIKPNNHSLADDRKPKIVPSVVSMDVVGSNGKISPLNNHSGGENKTENHVLDVKEETTYMSSSEDLKKVAKESILRRIPIGAEATTVLVGAVDFLEQPTIAFVRLAEGIYMPSITEVTIPVRFLFILLGPRQVGLDYHEIGRSISTLMSNTQFHKVAYKAEERKELLSAINEFLDDSIVIPPGDWDKKNLLPFGELKAKSDMIRRRKTTRLMQADDAQKALLPLGDGGKPPFDDPLRRTKRPFGGLINDLKRRFPFYVSDIKDGCNPQCLAAAIFMYFAALSGAITFGGLMADKTDNLIGISETLIATAASGILFALIAGQPLIIIGSTGPLLLFDESLYSFCVENGIEFLSLRVFIGMWLGIIALFVVCFEGSVLVKLFTRFTEEIFAALISILYIVESIMKLIVVFHKQPLLADYCTGDEFVNGNSTNNNTFNSSIDSVILNGHDDYFNLDENSTLLGMYQGNETDMIKYIPNSQHEHKVNQPNTALFCLILALGTFFIAYYLRHFRNSKFLGRSARRALGDFGVPIAIISMVLLDYMVPEIYTEKLHVPAGLSPSNPEVRGWLIIPVIDSVWLIFAAAAPALLIYILLFMETHICELIINKKERKLKKGSGFHLDIVIVCLANVGCGLMGAPWQCAATVRSIAHVSALTVMSRTHAPGDKPHIIEVKEQRLSALMVSLLVGASVLMAPLLRLVPMSVLFGVFLYMGISSTNGIQFFDRLQLFFMPVKHHPEAAYVKRVHQAKMHLFTFIQLMCLAILWVVKSTEASLAFPFFLILMVPLRRQLRFVFTPAELRALDSEEADEAEDEPDFYEEAPLPG